jgi:GT2 family glycosyltransferase
VPRVSALIVSYNTRDLLVGALASLAVEPDLEAIVVDNASMDGSPEAVAERFPGVALIRSPTNVGFAAATNRAAREAHAPLLLLLNPDAALCPGALDMLIAFLEDQPRVAAVAPALVYADGQPQDNAFRFPGLAQLLLDLFPVGRLTASSLNGRVRATAPVRIDHPLGACVLIRRAAWDEVGPLDEGYFMYVEEVDWCRRAASRGWQVWFEPRARAVHASGAATRQHADAMLAQLWRSRLRYYQRFYGPAYNRLVHAVVRLGMRAEARRTRSAARRRAIAGVRQLVA